MEKKHRFAMLAAIVHIVNGDWASLVHALVDMDVVRPGTSIRRITMVSYLHWVIMIKFKIIFSSAQLLGLPFDITDCSYE